MFLKIFIISLALFFAEEQLSAYQKQILIASFKLESNADREFEKIDSQFGKNKKIINFEKKGITFHKKVSGNYFVISLEPFDDINDLYKAMRVVKKKYRGAFYTNLKEKHIKLKVPQVTDALEFPKKELLLYKDIDQYISEVSKEVYEEKAVNEVIQIRKIETLSQRSMESYLHEMKKYSNEIEQKHEVLKNPFNEKEKESYFPKITLNDFLMGIAFFGFFYYLIKFTVFKKPA